MKDILLVMKGIFKLLGSIILLLGLVMMLALPFAYWTDRTLDYWVSLIMGHNVDVPLFVSFTVTVLLNIATVLINTVSEIFRLFM